MARWNSGEDHGGVTVDELKSLLEDWKKARAEPVRREAQRDRSPGGLDYARRPRPARSPAGQTGPRGTRSAGPLRATPHSGPT